MTDRYQRFAHSGVGRLVTNGLGLPRPAKLRRFDPQAPEFPGPVRLSGVESTSNVAEVLGDLGVEIDSSDTDRCAGAIFDATGMRDPGDLEALRAFFRPAIRAMGDCGRVLVIGRAASELTTPREAATHAALEGFIRSVGKELRAGGTANLLRVSDDAIGALGSSLRFFLSGRSAFVSGQVVDVTARSETPQDPSHPLRGKNALVTGAARGIGAVTAEVLARYGAKVTAVDLTSNQERLETLAKRLDGTARCLDLADEDSQHRLVAGLRERGGADIVVHNAGLTRDKTLAGMEQSQWEAVLNVNLDAPLRITERMLDESALRPGGRVVVMSSVMGIAGNRGQTNYAASKAGLIGMVRALAPQLSAHHVTANAVAPNFIETDMTASMPLFTREAGRRLSSLSQGGQPVDVAETIAWLADPGSAGITGQVVRVCGQSLLGA